MYLVPRALLPAGRCVVDFAVIGHRKEISAAVAVSFYRYKVVFFS